MRYPLVESLTALLFLMSYFRFGLSLEFGVYALFAAILVSIAFIDLDHLIIPDLLIILGLLPGVYTLVVGGQAVFVQQFTGAVGLGAIFWAIRIGGERVFKKEAMGFGDVKFAAMAGWVLGWELGIVAMFLAFLIATLLFMVLLPLKIIDRKQQVPFGPFICMGIWLGLLYGHAIIHWYLGLFVGI